MLAGQHCAGAAVPLTGGVVLPDGTYGSGLRALDTASKSSTPLVQRVAQSGADLFRVATTFGPTLAATKVGGANDLAGQLDVVARCIAANAPTRVYSVQLGGFDFHADEKAAQSTLLGQLDAAVSGFLTTMAAGPHGKDVVMVLYSEFGRRVAANGSQGTDHGTAGNIFVAGAAVNGGMFGDQPSLTDLVDGRLEIQRRLQVGLRHPARERARRPMPVRCWAAETSRGSPSSEPPPGLLPVIMHKCGSPSASGYHICA